MTAVLPDGSTPAGPDHPVSPLGRYSKVATMIARGWDPVAHLEAVLSRDEDQIALTRPTNFLTEDEMSIWDCPGCLTDDFGPSHFASPRCESGHHPHCTCDICF